MLLTQSANALDSKAYATPTEGVGLLVLLISLDFVLAFDRANGCIDVPNPVGDLFFVVTTGNS